MDKKSDTGMGGRGLSAGNSNKNDGREVTSFGKGQKMSVDYGKDSSSVSGRNERIGSMGGSVTNLSHSLGGTNAKQTGQ